MLKLVDKGSDEHRIYADLLHATSYTEHKTFPGVLPPLAILDTPHQYVVVSMPMCGRSISASMGSLTEVCSGGAILYLLRTYKRRVNA